MKFLMERGMACTRGVVCAWGLGLVRVHGCVWSCVTELGGEISAVFSHVSAELIEY